MQKIRNGEGPQFVEAQTIRWPGNEARWPTLPVKSDISLAWDESPIPQEARRWYHESDPLMLFIRELVAKKMASRDELKKLQMTTKNLISEVADYAVNRPLASPDAALVDVLR